MNAVTPLTDLETLADLHMQDALHFRDILLEMVELGAKLTRRLVPQTEAEPEAPAPGAGPSPAPTQDCTSGYASVTRSMRRSILLAQRLTDPKSARAVHEATTIRAAVRQQIVRGVEDAINREAKAAEAGNLHAELLERIEQPEFDADLNRPVIEVINEIRADLGIHGPDSLYYFKRRTPEDITILRERAAAPCRQPVGPYNLPMPPPGWTGGNPRAGPPA